MTSNMQHRLSAVRLHRRFSGADHRNPPGLGSWITYCYIGLNEASVILRFTSFTSFMRVRENMPPPDCQGTR